MSWHENPNVLKYCRENNRHSMADILNCSLDNFAREKTIRLVLKVDQFFKRSKLGSIWGTLYFQLDDNEFYPEKGWTDLVGAFLRIWLSALISIADGSQKKQDASFLDGPLTVYLSSDDRNLVQLTFVHREATRYSATATTKELLGNAITVAKDFLVLCRQRDWANDDTEAVAALTRQGIQALGQLRVGA